MQITASCGALLTASNLSSTFSPLGKSSPNWIFSDLIDVQEEAASKLKAPQRMILLLVSFAFRSFQSYRISPESGKDLASQQTSNLNLEESCVSNLVCVLAWRRSCFPCQWAKRRYYLCFFLVSTYSIFICDCKVVCNRGYILFKCRKFSK